MQDESFGQEEGKFPYRRREPGRNGGRCGWMCMLVARIIEVIL